jgi:hypothetical protein
MLSNSEVHSNVQLNLYLAGKEYTYLNNMFRFLKTFSTLKNAQICWPADT